MSVLNRLIRTFRAPDQIWCCDRCRDSSVGAGQGPLLLESGTPAIRPPADDPQHEHLLLRVKLET